MDQLDATFFRAVTAFLLQLAVLSGLGWAAPRWVRRLSGRPLTEAEALALGVAAPAALGYVAFWLYFASPPAGRLFSWFTLAATAITLAVGLGSGRPRSRLRGSLALLTGLAGLFYVGALFIFPAGDFSATAGARYLSGLPADNQIPGYFAARLYDGNAEKSFGGDWLESDRPPLQTGIVLLTMPALRVGGWSDDASSSAAGVWFELLWIPSVAVFLRWLGATDREAVSGCAGLAFTGFFLFHSVFVWPKLGGGALMLLAFSLFFPAPGGTETGAARRCRGALAGGLAALAALAHGGLLFSLLALAVLALAAPRRAAAWRVAAVAFLVIYSPWIAYQRLCAPPGNRLIKWHIAGAIPPDARSVGETLRENYRAQGWAKSWAARRANLATVLHGGWGADLGWRTGPSGDIRRVNEWYYSLHAPGWWLAGLAALPWLAFRGGAASAWRGRGREQALAIAWLGLTLGLWVALMFFPNSTVVHQGSFAVELVLLGLLAAWALFAGRAFFLGLFFLQAAHFAVTWLPASDGKTVPAARAPELVCAAGALALVGLLIANLRRDAAATPLGV